MPHNSSPRVMKHYFPTGRRNYGRLLKWLLDTWNRNGSTSGPTPWKIYDDDDDDDAFLHKTDALRKSCKKFGRRQSRKSNKRLVLKLRHRRKDGRGLYIRCFSFFVKNSWSILFVITLWMDFIMWAIPTTLRALANHMKGFIPYSEVRMAEEV